MNNKINTHFNTHECINTHEVKSRCRRTVREENTRSRSRELNVNATFF